LFSFSDETQINNDIIFSRIWKFGDGSESALKNPIKIYNSFGTFNVKLITITDKGCVDSASQIINIIKDPIAGKIAGKIDNLQPNQPYLYNINQQLSHSYNWLIDNGAIVSGQGTNAVTVQWFSNGLGNLKCILTNSSGCVDTAYISLNIGTTGYSQNLDSKINIFPNPTFDIVFIDGLEENTIISLEIFDIHGKLILLDKIKKYGFLDFSNYEQGVYFVKIGDVVKRVIKL
jgi:PKD repeat protein